MDKVDFVRFTGFLTKQGNQSAVVAVDGVETTARVFRDPWGVYRATLPNGTTLEVKFKHRTRHRRKETLRLF